jgi:hypothetical protein
MSIKRIAASAALGVCMTLAVTAAPATAAEATSTPSSTAPLTLPQVSSATQGAAWLAKQFNASGYIPTASTPPGVDYISTANAVLALASTGTYSAVAQRGLTYLSSHVNDYVKVDGSDGPGQLALLILDSHALGKNPTSFGGTNLVARLIATERTTGADKGLFGSQDPTYDGAYRQGLALAALAGIGVTTATQVKTAESWLESQQCPDGGWTSLITSANPCNGNPADFEGPDTNSTALAIQGLSAQGVLSTTAAAAASKFIVGAQDGDGGWGYDPNAAHAPGFTDPDSTALVIQAILALGKAPSSGTFEKGSSNPISALHAFQLTSGSGKGAFFFPGSTAPDLLATYQAVPAMARVSFPFNLAVTTSSLPKGSVGGSYSQTLAASGGTASRSWRLISGTLPAGLSLHSTTGVISGRPTHTGVSTFTVEVLDAESTTVPHTQATAWKTLSIDI